MSHAVPLHEDPSLKHYACANCLWRWLMVFRKQCLFGEDPKCPLCRQDLQVDIARPSQKLCTICLESLPHFLFPHKTVVCFDCQNVTPVNE